MNDDFDVDAYFERLSWRGETKPTLETLSGLLRAQVERIPFENLDVLLGRPPRLDLAGLQDKLVRRKRGGYCFEHATLMAGALEKLGFRVARHTARVVLVMPREAAPRAHMFLVVTLPEGRFVVDPGFGGLAARVPVPLDSGIVGEERHRMAEDGGWRVLRAETGGKLGDLWVSTFDRDNPVDFEMGNHFTATHPASPFVNRLMLRAYTPKGRVSAMNRDVTVIEAGQTRTFQLKDRAQLRGLLIEHFGFDLPETEQLKVPAVPKWA